MMLLVSPFVTSKNEKLPEEEAQHTTMVRGEEVNGRTLVAEARVVACPIFSVAVGGMKNSLDLRARKPLRSLIESVEGLQFRIEFELL